MDITSIRQKTAETGALSLLLVFLSGYVLFTMLFGFYLSVFVALLAPALVLGVLFPRAAMLASLVMTILFERFYTLSPVIWNDIEYKLYPLDLVLGIAFVSAFVSWMKNFHAVSDVAHSYPHPSVPLPPPRLEDSALPLRQGEWGQPARNASRNDAGGLPSGRGTGDRILRFTFIDWMLIAFFLLVSGILVASLFGGTGTSLQAAFSTWKNYVFYGLSYFLVRKLFRTGDDMRHAAKVLLSAVTVAIVFLVIGIVRGEGLWTEFTPLSTSGTRILAFPHAFYYSLASVAILFSARLWISERLKRNLLFLLLAVLTIGIVGSLMRHLWLGIAGALVFGFVFFPYECRKTLLRLGAYVGAAVLAVSVLGFIAFSLDSGSDLSVRIGQHAGTVVERISSMNDPYDESIAWRQEVWKSSLAKFAESPVFGVGFGAQVPVELADYRAFVEVRDMHNSWLAMLIQTGIVGMGVFALFLGSLFVKLFRLRLTDDTLRAARQVLLGLIVFQSLVFFSQPYLETNLLGLFFWVTLGFARSLIGMERESAPASMNIPSEEFSAMSRPV